MVNNTFFIVARELDEAKWRDNPHRDRWGWEVIDGEFSTWAEVLPILNEYQKAMPHHVVRIRAVPI